MKYDQPQVTGATQVDALSAGLNNFLPPSSRYMSHNGRPAGRLARSNVASVRAPKVENVLLPLAYFAVGRYFVPC